MSLGLVEGTAQGLAVAGDDLPVSRLLQRRDLAEENSWPIIMALLLGDWA
ncbi:MAG: hypothetical protein JO329_23150 [Planctomycetaceae bacterium]|nr:hypothetical protein [Planctomycetaceae bacterium]